MTTFADPTRTTDDRFSIPTASVDFAPGLDTIFDLQLTEDNYRIEDVEGDIPAFVEGSYFLNGPAKFSRGGFKYRHWLDGDGMVCSLRFSNGEVWLTNRFVRTNKFSAEQKAGRPIFRTFGTAFPGDSLNHGMALESPANVSVYPFHGKLLAFGEQALPWELDPLTLQTVGSFNFGGALSEISPFSAHPKFDPVTGELFNFGVFFSGKTPKLYFYSFDRAGKLRTRTSHELPYPSSIHDFSISRDYAVIYVSPHMLEIEGISRAGRSVMESLSWQPERGSFMLVIDRHSGQKIASIPLEGRYCLHMINSFEEDGMLFVDVLELDRPVYDQYQPLPNLLTDVGPGAPVRYVLDPARGRVFAREECEYHQAPDFPALDPALHGSSYHEFWMLGVSHTGSYGRKFFDQLVHASWGSGQFDVFQADPKKYLGGEPVFVPGPEPGEGALICQQFDADRTQGSFLIFDAFDVSRGPIASLRLMRPVHLGFHASFLSEGES